MNCRRREAPAAAQDSSYVGKEGGKEGHLLFQQCHSASLSRVAFHMSHPEAPNCPHALIAHQYLSQDMDCKVSKHQRIFVFLRI